MITGEDLLRGVESAFQGETARHFRYPFILLEVRSAEFADKDDDEREEELLRRTGFAATDYRQTLDRLFIRTQLRAPGEPPSTRPDEGYFWLRSLAETQPAGGEPKAKVGVPAVHFYGYKGGQARSTVLAFLSSVLATSGWRVLVVDADAEAPSADIIFQAHVANPEASLVGLRAGLPCVPVRALSGSDSGFVDLLAFRPSDPRYDLDAAALALEQTLAPSALAKLAERVATLAAGRYDLVLIDHRTGLSPTVLPWVSVFSGPVVVFARLDGQWRPARRHLRALWRMAGEDPGVVVSFKGDTDPIDRYRTRVRPQAETLLDDLAEVTAEKGSSTDEEGPTGDQISDHWIVWPFDSAFVDGCLPEVKSVGGPTEEAVADLRRLLSLGAAPVSAAPTLHRSGAQDEGDLIQTSALRALSGPNNYLFVLGRKGTGKTRLVRALAESRVGEPLFVADDDEGDQGIRANWAEWNGLAGEMKGEPIRLWWMLFVAAMEQGTTDRRALETRLPDLKSLSLSELVRRARASSRPAEEPRLLLVDGLETAFQQSQVSSYLSELIHFVSTLDSDASFRAAARLQVFLRPDLAFIGYENFEQLSQGRILTLEWDAQSIMNFLLSRIVALPWFRESFEPAVAEIQAEDKRFRAGAVEESRAEELLLKIFPERLRRLNLKMTTFMRTYFSDDPDGKKSFYPRIYDEFLKYIDEQGAKTRGYEGIDSERRVSQQLISAAHEYATIQFLNQVKSELRNLVGDSRTLNRILDALRGTTTPFRLKERIRQVASRTDLSEEDVRAAMDQMRNIGIFEEREGNPGQWRAGRLFKSALGMLYARGNKSPDREP